jgi:hypothetical protein
VARELENDDCKEIKNLQKWWKAVVRTAREGPDHSVLDSYLFKLKEKRSGWEVGEGLECVLLHVMLEVHVF